MPGYVTTREQMEPELSKPMPRVFREKELKEAIHLFPPHSSAHVGLANGYLKDVQAAPRRVDTVVRAGAEVI